MDPRILREVAEQTTVLRAPKQALATFGTTSIRYYLLSEPSYAGLPGSGTMRETVVRTGQVNAERPQIVTPYYLLSLFHGFEHGHEFARHLVEAYGQHSPGLMYSYSNELTETTIVADDLPIVARRLAEDLDHQGQSLSAIVRGVDSLWDVSLMKFIFELTLQSLGQNVADLGKMGLLGEERGIPRAVRARIDELFAAVSRNELPAAELKAELDRWGVFSEYEDRFLNLFRR